MSRITFEQLQINLNTFQLQIDSSLASDCFQRVKSGGDLLVLTEENESVLVSLLSGFVERLQVPADDDAPRVLIVCPTKELCLLIEDLWLKVSKRTEMVHTLTYEDRDKIKQRNALFDGADVVIGTPKRVNELYFRNGINVNLLKFFLVFDAENCVKNSSVLHISRMCESFPKCQKIIISSSFTNRTEKLADEILTNPLEIKA